MAVAFARTVTVRSVDQLSGVKVRGVGLAVTPPDWPPIATVTSCVGLVLSATE